MADDTSNIRQSFLSSFGSDVQQFLEASESVDDDDEIKMTDLEITTDLGSSTSVQSPASPLLSRSLDGRRTTSNIYPSQAPIPEDPHSDESVEKDWRHADTPLPHADTPLPHADTPLPDSDIPVDTESSSEITVHQDDSLNTEVLKQMAGVTHSSITRDSLEEDPIVDVIPTDQSDSKEGHNVPVRIEVGENTSEEDFVDCESDPVKSRDNNKNLDAISTLQPTREPSNLLDKVSFMESSVQNNTLMETGASLPELPLEEETDVKQDTPEDEALKAESEIVSLEDEVDKILEEVRSSERCYSSDQFESDEGGMDSDKTLEKPDQLHIPDQTEDNIHHLTTPLNPLESTPKYSGNKHYGAGFDLSPVISAGVHQVEESKSESTSNLEYSQEKDMAYYLAKIKAKAAQRTQEIRSSIETSKDSLKSEPTEPKHKEPVVKPKTIEFVKPKTPAPKKKLAAKKPMSFSKNISSGNGNKHQKRPGSNCSKTKIIAQSPIAAYIKGGVKVNKEVKQGNFGSTWTNPATDNSLVEVIQANGDVEAWRELYNRTQSELAEVRRQLDLTESSHKDSVKTLKTAHSQELHKYKQDIYILQSRVKSSAIQNAADVSVDSRVAALVKQVAELETLLTGYQTENVKLYEEVRIGKEQHKEEQTRLYLENKELASDNVALKQILQQRESTIRQLKQQQQSLVIKNTVSNLPKLAELQQQLDAYKDREILYKQRIDVLSGGGGGERQYSDAAVNSSLVQVDNQITSLVKEHTAEREQLYNRLEALLSENNALKMDQDLLKRREQHISELQHTIRTLQSPEYEQRLIARATTENNSITADLKRQVAELESVLRKRQPDSIASLIAASHPPDYTTKITEMQNHLEKVKAEYDAHIERLTSDKTAESELNKVQQMNRVFHEKVNRLEGTISELEDDLGKLERENRDLKEGQIPSGEIKHKIDNLNMQLRNQDDELEQLKSRLILAAAPAKKQYVAQQFEEKHISELRKENSILKTKCDLLKIENDQKKATMVGLRIECETSLSTAVEGHTVKMERLMMLHEEERQKMIVQHAARFAESEVSKLKSKIDTLELQVSHYSELAAQLPEVNSDVKALRIKEKTLAGQLVKLGNELQETHAQQPPTIQQYKTLQQKVSNIETGHKTQISELQETIRKLESGRIKVVTADDVIIRKYKEQLIEKNIQIEKFQNELDAIISLCMELQAHGVVLPAKQRFI